MPIYEYICEKCGNRIEKLLSVSDGASEIKCTCGGAARKQISASSFHLKGNGWYRSDYKKQPKQDCPSKTDSPACNCCTHNSEAPGQL
jgi:putative FmdB family regulatory protein